ncbi:3'-5' exonuclease [Marinomonas sp. A79]|uniref:3'-5' exonuclease n=1 Tax=Marinomonas vulgaris TaxID=2823372 RepID=A0ABS5HD77_9GAMM|nr:3'-5' exonuclease [Marinomonas vulgaris]MBR7889618.1 3'-5' exonuclease [Marinomonas vulgaris]
MGKSLVKKTPKADRQDWQAMYAEWAKDAPEGPLKRFYEAGMISAQIALKDAPLLALDLETTGLDSSQDEIISLGLIPLNHRTIRCQGAKYWMAKPKRALNAESVTIHEITHAELAEAPRLEAILEEILAALAQHVIVVHCVSIERQFLLEAAMKIYGYPLYFPVLDTMDIERQAIHQPWWKRFGKQPSLRLDACRQRYKLPRYKAHHALTDALSSAELLQAQMSYHMDLDADIASYWV